MDNNQLQFHCIMLQTLGAKTEFYEEKHKARTE